MKHIYCISGFGADDKLFSKFDLHDHRVHFIHWNIPAGNETIGEYAENLTHQIHHENPVLLGLSFGGMMCIEIAKIIPVQLVILISSIKSFHEMPYWMRLSGKLKLDKIFPMKSFKFFEPLENYNLGIETETEKMLVTAYRNNIDQRYTDWAIDKILNWNNEWKPANLFHIHGDHDRIFPIKKIKADHIVADGGHFMIMNKAELVNAVLNQALQ
jgi:pimeloyl-ACP methyl ester carboxylesterase